MEGTNPVPAPGRRRPCVARERDAGDGWCNALGLGSGATALT